MIIAIVGSCYECLEEYAHIFFSLSFLSAALLIMGSSQSRGLSDACVAPLKTITVMVYEVSNSSNRDTIKK